LILLGIGWNLFGASFFWKGIASSREKMPRRKRIWRKVELFCGTGNKDAASEIRMRHPK